MRTEHKSSPTTRVASWRAGRRRTSEGTSKLVRISAPGVECIPLTSECVGNLGVTRYSLGHDNQRWLLDAGITRPDMEKEGREASSASNSAAGSRPLVRFTTLKGWTVVLPTEAGLRGFNT